MGIFKSAALGFSILIKHGIIILALSYVLGKIMEYFNLGPDEHFMLNGLFALLMLSMLFGISVMAGWARELEEHSEKMSRNKKRD